MHYRNIKNITDTSLPEMLNKYKAYGLTLWQYHMNNSNFNLFSISLSEEVLKEMWQQLRDDIALYFQTKLEKEVERWNIYIIFFTDESILHELKYKIEHDHYCARKIVIDNLNTTNGFSNEKVQKIIYSNCLL